MDERSRLANLHSYAILDTPPETDFDRLSKLAAFICQTPMAAISFIDETRQWFKSVYGFSLLEVPGTDALCAHIVSSGEPLVIRDTLEDARFIGNPLVNASPNVRFYIGIPLISPEGHALGILAVMDSRPRALVEEQVEHLTTLARQVMLQLEQRRKELVSEQITMGRVNAIFAASVSGIAIARTDGKILLANPALCAMLNYSEAELCSLTFQELTHPDDLIENKRLLGELFAGERANFILEKRYIKKNGEILWARISVASSSAIEKFPTGIFAVIEDISQRKAMEEQLQLNESMLNMAGQLAHLGGWRLDLPAERVIWSDEVCAIHEVPPGTAPSVDQAIQFYAPEWRSIISEKVALCIDAGLEFDEELQILTASGRQVWVRALGRAVRDSSGKINRVQGAFQDITDKKALESVLTQRHQHFNEFANAMPVVVWTANPEGKLDYGNKLFSQYTGLSHSEIVTGQLWMHAVHKDDAESALHLWNESIASGRLYLNEFRIRRYDGQYRWHLARAVPIRATDQRIIKWYGTAIDIHDRNVSEANAQQLAERLAITLESITDAFMTLDRNWRFTYINSEAERVLHRNREDLKGKILWQEFPESVGSIFEHHYRMAMTEGDKVSFQAFYAPLNTWFSVNVYPSSEGLAVYFQNVNAQREAEEHLRLLETCVAHMNDIVVITEAEPQDEPGPRIIFVNEAFVARTGYSREEVIGKSPRLLQGPKTQRPALQRIRESMKKWQPIREELINYTKAGEEFWLDIDLVPVADSSGWFTHWVAVERDISERKQAEIKLARIVELEQAQQLSELASKAKSHFLATMSHEIRTPISGVIGMVEVLHQSSLKGYQVEMVDIIRDSAQSLLGIIEDILDFSKIEAGKLEIESTPINLFDLVKSVCSILDRFAENKQVELTFFCDPALPETVMGDDLRLRQVLLNLVNNAIKFSSGDNRSGRVNLRVCLLSAEEDKVIVNFLIIDNGIGMAKETLARLFNPFVQADVSTTRHFGGTGLGLTICRHLVDLMGGRINVESQLDHGSRFDVTLSFNPAPAEMTEIPQLPDVSGLACVVLGEAQRLGDDIVIYLQAAGLEVARILEPAQIMRQARPQKDDARVWIFDAFNIDSWLAVIPTEFLPALRCVLINRGLRRKPRVIERNRVSVDGDLLDRYTLFKAIAVAAGRELADTRDIESIVPETAFSPPVRELALQQKRLILVAEDNETNQKVIARQLALLGYAADVVNNGREALEHLQTQKYSLLLTDLHMPEIDGYELARLIRAQDPGPDYLPIIALSANALRGEGERCRILGMDDYLTKPASLAELQNCIEHWLQQEAGATPITNASIELDDAPVKLGILKSLVGDDPEIVADFLNVFQKDTVLLANSFRKDAANANLTQLASVAHKLKSSARSVGAQVLGNISADIEAAAKAGDAAKVGELLQNFEHELALVNNYLNNR